MAVQRLREEFLTLWKPEVFNGFSEVARDQVGDTVFKSLLLLV
jgi:hypothetical protein